MYFYYTLNHFIFRPCFIVNCYDENLGLILIVERIIKIHKLSLYTND